MTDTGDVTQEVVLGLPDGTVADARIEVGVDVGELTLEPSDVLLDVLRHGGQSQAEAIVLGSDHVE